MMMVAMVTMATFPYVLEICENAHFGHIWQGELIQSTNMQDSVHNLWMQQGNLLYIVAL